MKDDVIGRVWKVLHAKGGVETVYIVFARTRREAERSVIELLGYPTEVALHWTPEEKARDVFGLMTPTAELRNSAIARNHEFTCNASPWTQEEPYRLYAIDRATGAMS